MSNALTIIRALLIYGLCLPVAIFLGYLLALPMDRTSFIIVALVIALPLMPILLRWHHLILIASWNMNVIVFFLPGAPNLWIVTSGLSLLLSILHRILNRDTKLLHVPALAKPLIFLALVILVTARFTGGIGLRSFGAEAYGGKRYIWLFGAIVGYFALSWRQIPPARAVLYISLFFLGGMTMSIASLGPMLDPSLYFIFAIFPAESVQSLMGEGMDSLTDPYSRLGGFSFGAMAAVSFILARHGMRGLFSLAEKWRFVPFQIRGGFGLNQPWRALFFLFCFWISLMGGFRSSLIMLVFTMLCQLYFEGLLQPRVLAIMASVGILGAVVCAPMVDKLPFSVQRSLSFLPLPIDPVARYSAKVSSEWRLNMWHSILPQVPKYLLLGKGYAINPAELEMSRSGAFSRTSSPGEVAIVAGDYHNGPLSLLIPLGIFGFIGFVWFVVASARVLWRNVRHGDSALQTVNSFLISYFLARTALFFFVFGSFYNELALFTGLVGLSVALNGGARGPAPVTIAQPVFGQFRLARAT